MKKSGFRTVGLPPESPILPIFARFLPKMQEKTSLAVVDKRGFFYVHERTNVPKLREEGTKVTFIAVLQTGICQAVFLCLFLRDFGLDIGENINEVIPCINSIMSPFSRRIKQIDICYYCIAVTQIKKTRFFEL